MDAFFTGGWRRAGESSSEEDEVLLESEPESEVDSELEDESSDVVFELQLEEHEEDESLVSSLA